MKGKIAIESQLTPFKDYLAGKGYNVESVDFNKKSTKNLYGFNAYVVTGMNSDFLGMQETQTKTVVINADGMTPEEVAKELERNTITGA